MASSITLSPDSITLFLVQLFIVVSCCRLMAYLIRYIKQPSVIAEVVTGIILGPSVFGYIPGWTSNIFPSSSIITFSVFANFGLIIFMFIVGAELDLNLVTAQWKHALTISVSAMITPFALGLASSWVIYHTAIDQSVSFTSFLLFVAVAQSITAFPVLARIITERKLLETKVGNIALSAAAVDDFVAWCVLAVVVAIAKSTSALNALWTFMILVGFIVFVLTAVRWFLCRIAVRRKSGANINLHTMALILLMMFVFAWFTDIIGIDVIFGPFILGVATPRRKKFAAKLIERIEDVVVIILLPLYFTLSGLRTDIGTLNSAADWGLVLLIIVTACLGKISAATVSAKLLNNTWRDSCTIGVLMNTKGLVELIVLNLGLQVGVLNTRVFTMFVLMAIFTTIITTPLVWLIYERRQAKNTSSQRKGEYHVLLHAQERELNTWIGSVASLFFPKNEHTTVKALLIQEIGDRPSEYISAEFKRNRDKSLLTKKAKQAQIFFGGLKNIVEEKGASFSYRVLNTSNPPPDVTDFVEVRDYNLVIFEVQAQNVRSDANLLDKSLDKLEKSFNLDSANARIAQHGIDNISCAVGVLVDKILPTNEKIEDILFVWSGHENESYALTFARQLMMESNLRVTVATQVSAFGEMYGIKDNIEIILLNSKHEADEIVQKASRSFDLIIMAGNRKTNQFLSSTFIQQVDAPVLLLFSPLGQNQGQVLQEMPV